MVVSLFALLGWATIIVFFLIPKSLNTEENLILFFIINIITISIYTILTLNLRLLGSAENVASFIALWIQRSIIIPLCNLILMNLLPLYDNKLKKVITAVVITLILTFVDLLTLWVDVKTYTGWNAFLTAFTILVLVPFYYGLAKFIKKVS
jgi:hypothetical protein